MPKSTENKKGGWGIILFALGLFILDCWMVLAATVLTVGFITIKFTGAPVFAWYYSTPAIVFFSWILWGSRK